MISQEITGDLISVNIEELTKENPTDIRALDFDNSLQKEERIAYILQYLKIPFYFRYGQFGIKIEFDDDAPSLSEVLAGLLVRKKSGL